MTQKEMQSILEIGTAISSEKDYNRLLEMILNRIMELPRAALQNHAQQYHAHL